MIAETEEKPTILFVGRAGGAGYNRIEYLYREKFGDQKNILYASDSEQAEKVFQHNSNKISLIVMNDCKTEEETFSITKSLREKFKGKMLGLSSNQAYCKKFATTGCDYIVDLYGKNSTDEIYFTLEKMRKEKEVAKLEELKNSIEKPTILIVEDSKERLWKYAEKLAPYATIFVAEGLKEAEELFNKHEDNISVMVMDGAVRGGSTPKLVKKFKQTFAGPIIAASGDSVLMKELMDAGCTSQTGKDFVPEKVIEELLKLHDQKKANADKLPSTKMNDVYAEQINGKDQGACQGV